MSSVDEMNDWNAKVIAEFRENGGKVGGPFEGAPMVLVHHTGAKTGTERINPLICQIEGDRVYVFASKAGAADNPDWYHNLLAHPETTIEIGDESDVAVRVTELTGAERDRVWEQQKATHPQFAEYEANTDRTIPVLALERV